MAKYKEIDSSQDPQVPLLQARVIDLEDHIKDITENQAAEMKEMKEKQAAEMKQMKTRQDYMFQFMATINEHMPHLDLSNIFNEAHNDSCSAYVNPGPTSSRASQNHTSESRNSLIMLESLLLTLKRCLPSFKFVCRNELCGIELSQIRKTLEFKMTPILVPREDVKQQSGKSTIEAAKNPTVSSSTLKSKSNIIGISKGQGPHYFKKLSDSCMIEEVNTENQEHSVSNKSVTCLRNDKLIIRAEYGDDRTLLYLPISTKFVDIYEEEY